MLVTAVKTESEFILTNAALFRLDTLTLQLFCKTRVGEGEISFKNHLYTKWFLFSLVCPATLLPWNIPTIRYLSSFLKLALLSTAWQSTQSLIGFWADS